MSYSTFANWELGVQQPFLHSLDLLCKAFRRSPEQLGYRHLVEVPEVQARAARARVPLTALEGTTAGMPTLLEMAARACLLAQQQHGWSDKEVHARLEALKRSLMERAQPSINSDKLARRQLLLLLADLPVALLGLTMEGSSVPLFAEELLPLCASSIPACWQLYFDGELSEIERVLPVYCTRLAALAEQPSPYQQQAANFASQAYQLSCQLFKERENFGAALADCQQALTYAHLAGDVNLQVAALIRKANVYFEKRYPFYSPQAHQAYVEALPLLKHVTPLLQGRVYAGLAESHASMKQEQEALRYMGLAQDVYPADPKADPAFPYTGHSHSSLYILGEGLPYLRLGQPAKAQQALTRLEGIMPKTLGVRQLELRVRQAAVAVAVGDLEQSCFCLRNAMDLAPQIGSSLYHSQTIEVYQGMPPAWHREKSVQELAELFQV